MAALSGRLAVHEDSQVQQIRKPSTSSCFDSGTDDAALKVGAAMFPRSSRDLTIRWNARVEGC